MVLRNCATVHENDVLKIDYHKKKFDCLTVIFKVKLTAHGRKENLISPHETPVHKYSILFSSSFPELAGFGKITQRVFIV